jgi:acyl carrier protein
MNPQHVEDLVKDTAASVLAVDTATLASTDNLADLPTFSSFRIVAIVERSEEALGVEVDAAELTPDNLHRLDALCALFVRTAAKAG